MDMDVHKCVISKYEAQRCLPFSSCTVVPDYMPNIIIIGEYEKILEHRLVKYVVEREREFTDKDTGKKGTYIENVLIIPPAIKNGKDTLFGQNQLM